MNDIKNNEHILFEILTSFPHSRNEQILMLKKADDFPEIKERTFELFSSFIAPRQAIRKRIIFLTDLELSYNIKALKIAIAEYFSILSKEAFSKESIIKIYGKDIVFKQKTQIYKEHLDKLKVFDILEIIRYALEYAKQFCNMETSKIEEGLLILKSIDLALNNNPYEQPDFKSANLVLDILSFLAQKMESDPEIRNHISGGIKVVQLAINFFKRNNAR